MVSTCSKIFASVFAVAEEEILKEAGPSIFFQSHSLIVPSGSLEAEPSNEMLSVGKVITWSGPCYCDRRFVIFFAAFAGCFFFAGTFLQELKNKIPAIKASNKRVCFGFKKRFYGSIVFSLKKFNALLLQCRLPKHSLYHL